VQCQVKNKYQLFVNRTDGRQAKWSGTVERHSGAAHSKPSYNTATHFCSMHIAINKQVSTNRIIQHGKQRTKKTAMQPEM